ncbi:MAG: DegT/DnrJ/EryC1/StrS family aminotransferase, partial [Candidatus Hydrogenedentales bacterium]
MLIARHRHEITAGQMLRFALEGRDARGAVEEWMRQYLGVPHGLLLPSGRAAIYWALRAAPERTVYMPAFTCIVAVEAVRLAGKQIRFVDIDPGSYNVPAAEYEKVLEPGGIVLATAQFGFPGELDQVCALANARECRVLEDCAGGLGGHLGGRPLGSFGDLAIFSFQHTKTASAHDAGMLAGRDESW